MEKTYNISKEYLKQLKNQYIFMLIFTPIAMLLGPFLVIGLKSYSSMLFGILLCFSLFIMLEILIIATIMYKKISKNSLTLKDDRLTRLSGKKSEDVIFSNITAITVNRTNKSNIKLIKIWNKNKKITLLGFDNFEEILETLRQNCPNSSFKEKTAKLDYDGPLFLATAATSAFLIFSGLNNISISFYNVFMSAVGFWFVFCKPVSSSQGSRFRKIELILGPILILLNILFMII